MRRLDHWFAVLILAIGLNACSWNGPGEDDESDDADGCLTIAHSSTGGLTLHNKCNKPLEVLTTDERIEVPANETVRMPGALIVDVKVKR